MRIGAHVSTNGGLIHALNRAQSIGAQCLQIFSSPPLQWKSSIYTTEQKQLFRQTAQQKNLFPIFIHGAYLINLAAESAFLIEQSKESLIHDMHIAHDIGASGVIFHFGSHKEGWTGRSKQILPVIEFILQNTPADTLFIIENSAGSGSTIGSTLEELASIRTACQNERVRICLDTAHAYASGYNINTPETAGEFVARVESSIGWKYIAAIHLNDSKVSLGKKVDRHENIGEGQIGVDGFKALLTHPLLSNIPIILEVPGKNRQGPNVENIHRVRQFFTA